MFPTSSVLLHDHSILIIPSTLAVEYISEGHWWTLDVYRPLTQLYQHQPAPEHFSVQGPIISAENKYDPRTLLVSVHPVWSTIM